MINPAHTSPYYSLSFALVTTAASSSLSAATIYSETFDNSSGNNLSSGAIGWKAYASSSATVLTNIAPNTGNRIGISSLAGNPSTDGIGYYFASNAQPEPRI